MCERISTAREEMKVDDAGAWFAGVRDTPARSRHLYSIDPFFLKKGGGERVIADPKLPGLDTSTGVVLSIIAEE